MAPLGPRLYSVVEETAVNEEVSMNGTEEVTLGGMVARDYRTAAILEKYGLDFCCGGRQSLADACRAKGVDPEGVLAELARLDDSAAAEPPFASCDLDELVAHIVSTHHVYVKRTLPALDVYLQKLVAVHGGRHPELTTVREHFAQLARELTLHMAKEEEILFPYISALARVSRHEQDMPPNMFGTVQNPIRMLEGEHESAGHETELIRVLTGGYAVPGDGCTTYRVAFEELSAFERDLHRHVHLENNILFPRAVELEARLTSFVE